MIFKPSTEGAEPKATDAIRGVVTIADPDRDLAIVSYPEAVKLAKPIEFGSESDIQVGDDVFAIGHPIGEAWTFTREIISQFRKNYEWKTEENASHEADVIQTQTPINPGNSGGPLLASTGKLIGVNSFKATEGEGINFAIAVTTIRSFLASPSATNEPRGRTASAECQPKVLYEGRDKANTSFIRLLDIFCTGKANALYRMPDDEHRSIAFLINSSGNGKPDIWIYNSRRVGKWDHSLYSVNHDDKINLIGHHPDGKLIATWYEQYNGQATPWAN